MLKTVEKIILLLLLGIFNLIAETKAGMVAENSYSASLGRSIFEPNVMDNPNRKIRQAYPAPKIEDNSRRYNYDYDYNKDANRITDVAPAREDNRVKIVDLDNYNTAVVVQQGQFIAVRLEEEEMTKWNFDNRNPNLEFIKSEKRGNTVIMLYLAADQGTANINFDKLHFDNNIVSAVSSKVLAIKVM